MTAFATIINTGSGTATSCSIAPVTSVPATFTFQTTNSTTNQVTGTPNTPVDIPSGRSQSFVFGFTPTAPFSSTDIQLSFNCTNTTPATVISGVNTLLLSAASTAIPDIVALAATFAADGIAHAIGDTGTAAFAVATANLGASGSITALADTGNASLPVTITMCQTNPTTGLCVSSIGPTVPTQINANETPTFAVFVSATGTVSFNPAVNRVFVRFRDGSGVTRGATSVAVRSTTPVTRLFLGGGLPNDCGLLLAGARGRLCSTNPLPANASTQNFIFDGSPGDWTTTLVGSLTGSGFGVSLQLAMAPGQSAQGIAQIILKRTTTETVLFTTPSFTVNSSTFRLFTFSGTGQAASGLPGDRLILRVTCTLGCASRGLGVLVAQNAPSFLDMPQAAVQ